jgi:hypothetical protein
VNAAPLRLGNTDLFVSEGLFVDMMVAAFFSRGRASAGSLHRDGDVGEDWTHLDDWTSLRRHLLPLLSRQVKAALGARLIERIRAALLMDTDARASPLQPRKWARHACGLLSLLVSRQALVDSSSTNADVDANAEILITQCLAAVGLLDTERVVDLAAKSGEGESAAASRTLCCLVALSEFWRGDSEGGDGETDNDLEYKGDQDQDQDKDHNSSSSSSSSTDSHSDIALRRLLPCPQTTAGTHIFLFLLCYKGDSRLCFFLSRLCCKLT